MKYFDGLLLLAFGLILNAYYVGVEPQVLLAQSFIGAFFIAFFQKKDFGFINISCIFFGLQYILRNNTYDDLIKIVVIYLVLKITRELLQYQPKQNK